MRNRISYGSLLICLFLVVVTCPSGASAQKKQTSHSKPPVKRTAPTPSKKQTAPPVSFQNKSVINFTQNQVDTFQLQSIQMVSFLQGMLNFLANGDNPVKDRQTIMTSSYLKIFWNSKVQVEDDLDQNRGVPLYKEAPSYLSDVNFFFRKAKFQYTVQNVNVLTNGYGQTYFRVTANRNLRGTLVSGDTVNWNKVRYIEINYNDSLQELKIVSIYTTKLNELDDMRIWWNGLPDNWKRVFGKDLLIQDTLHLCSISSFHDSVANIGSSIMKIDSTRIFRVILQIIRSRTIDLSGNQSVTNLEPLSKLSSLTSVNISSTPVVDIQPLRNLNDLEELDISGTPVNSIEPLKYATKIRVLKMKKTMINDISFLSGFSGLEILDISGTPVESLDPIKEVVSLKDIRLADTRISSLEPLSSLGSLTMVNFSGTSISDASPLKNLKNIELVLMNSTKVADLNAFKELPRLTRIYCENSLVKSADAVSFMITHPSVLIVFQTEALMKWWKNMPVEWKKVFNFYANLGESPTTEQLHRLISIDSINVNGRSAITTLSPVSMLSRLSQIQCNSTQVVDLTPLKDLVELKSISAYGTKINDVGALAGLKNLEILNIDNTGVKNISSLSKLDHLKYIYADNTGITADVSNHYIDENPDCIVIFQTYENNQWWGGLAEAWKEGFRKQLTFTGTPDKIILQKIANLSSFSINGEINSVAPVLKLNRLKEFQLSDTHVSTLDPLGRMIQLQVLRCTKSPVTDLTPIANLYNLKELDVSNTQVEDLEPIQNLTNIEIFKFSGTPVKNLKYLKKMTKMREMEFYNTRVSNLDVLEFMPGLKSLKIFNTKISENRVAKYKAAHPGCDVVFY